MRGENPITLIIRRASQGFLTPSICTMNDRPVGVRNDTWWLMRIWNKDLPGSGFRNIILVQGISLQAMVENMQTLSFRGAYFARRNPNYLDYPNRVTGISHSLDLHDECQACGVRNDTWRLMKYWNKDIPRSGFRNIILVQAISLQAMVENMQTLSFR